ncbi:MAG: tetratricopeptide repeat protein, partial [Lentisphaeraceae bacterium]|nr:tetratricopeptide repeat protein [Lentisphaeraceae bacterium]
VKKKQRSKELALYLNFPVQKDQQTDVTCLANPKFKYEIYLPPQYDHSGRILLPIIYFFHPGRKSYIQKYKNLAKEMGLILVTNYQTHGKIDYTRIHDSWYAMMKDIQSRVHFEPGRQFSSGHSGGGFFCYDFARQFSHHISGTVSMGGWLANRHDERWQWFREDFLVARVSGEKDNGKSYLDRDFRHMDKYNVKLKDWQAPNRSPSPPTVYKEVLTWLYENTDLANDKKEAEDFKERCISYISKNQYGQALNESLQIIIDKPYTFSAIAAQQIIEKILDSEKVDLKNNFTPEELAFESPIVIDLIGFYISVGGITKNHVLFNNAVDCLEKANRLLEWDYLTTWRMLTSSNKQILDYEHAEKIIMKRKEISSLKVNHKIFLGLIYKFKGRDMDAKKLYEEAKLEVDSGASHNSSMFKKLQRLMQ